MEVVTKQFVGEFQATVPVLSELLRDILPSLGLSATVDRGKIRITPQTQGVVVLSFTEYAKMISK